MALMNDALQCLRMETMARNPVRPCAARACALCFGSCAESMVWRRRRTQQSRAHQPSPANPRHCGRVGGKANPRPSKPHGSQWNVFTNLEHSVASAALANKSSSPYLAQPGTPWHSSTRQPCHTHASLFSSRHSNSHASNPAKDSAPCPGTHFRRPAATQTPRRHSRWMPPQSARCPPAQTS